MRHRPGVFLVLALLGLTTSAAAQSTMSFYLFRLWQIEPDGTRHSAGGFGGGGTSDFDFRIWIKPDRRIAGDMDYRLDADFVVHRLADSTVMIGEIVATREVSASADPGDSIRHARLEEETFRRTLVLHSGGGTTAWFYPFGIPRQGERGIAFEISPASSAAGAMDLPVTRDIDFLLRGARSYGIVWKPRTHSVRARLEVGSPGGEWNTVYEGDVLTRLPLRVPLAGKGARGVDMVFELQAPEWGVPPAEVDDVCWRWSWADRQPPGGGSCTGIHEGTAVQRLYGSRAGFLRVTILSKS